MKCMVTKPVKKGETIKVFDQDYVVVKCEKIKDSVFYNVEYAEKSEEKDE